MSVVVREWTPIGTEGFQYYWDPNDLDPVEGLPYISWIHSWGYTARAFVDWADAEDQAILGYLLDQRTKDLEDSYRLRIKQSEGLADGSSVWY
jgi:hypothetical protein